MSTARATPAARIRAAAAQLGAAELGAAELGAAELGAAELARRCGDVLATGTCADDLLVVLGGQGAAFVYGEHKVDQTYWIRTWALRALLYVWDESVTPQVVAALGHDHWRVREMAAKVAARRQVGAAGDALAALDSDETPRVRAAAARGLGEVAEAEHADAVGLLLHDEDESVRARAAQALDLMQHRLDKKLDAE